MTLPHWLKKYAIWIAFVLWTLLILGLVTALRDGDAVKSVVGMVGNVTNGLIGAIIGAGAAIVYAERSRTTAETRKREAVAFMLYNEQRRNLIWAQYLNKNIGMPIVLSYGMQDKFESHAELFTVATCSKVSVCRDVTMRLVEGIEGHRIARAAFHDHLSTAHTVHKLILDKVTALRDAEVKLWESVIRKSLEELPQYTMKLEDFK